MLATIATTNTKHGDSLLNPSDSPNAVAHTASRTPDTTRITHDMTFLPGRLVAHRVRHPSSGSQSSGLCFEVLTTADASQCQLGHHRGLSASAWVAGLD